MSMALYKFSEEEVESVFKKYKKLKLNKNGFIEGEILLNHTYDDIHIKDKFQIVIGADEEYPKTTPRLMEVGKRTEKIAQKYNIKDFRDLHNNSKDGGTVCLGSPREIRNKFPVGSDLVVFVDDLVIPYLFGFSFYEKHKKWPWGELSHGILGILEDYLDIKDVSRTDIDNVLLLIKRSPDWIDYNKQIKKLSPQKHCICGSCRPFCKCHSDAWKGLEKLVCDMKKFNLNVKSALSQIKI